MIDWAGRKLARFLDTRLRLAKFAKKAMNHVFPDHWSFMLGEVALYSFIILVITGAYLAMFYNSSTVDVKYHGSYFPLRGLDMSAAYQSVLHISFDVPAGLLIRQMHHWAADIFIAAIVVHLARIFFTAAYRRPREINWMVGVTLLVLALANGYFGYSIAGDLLSGAGLRIGYAILMSVPVIGQWLAFLFFGSMVPASATLPRFYSLHIFLVPALIAALIGIHIAIIWRQFHTNFPGPRRTNYSIVGSRLFPSYTMKSIGLFCLLFAFIAFLGGFVQIDPIWTYGPFNPIAILPGAQPDWYLGWVEGAMRLFPGVNVRPGGYLIPEVFFPAILLPVLVFLGLYAYPWVDKLFTMDIHHNHHVLKYPYQQPVNTAIGCAAFMMLLVLFFAGGDDVIAMAIGGSVATIRVYLRILFFIAPVVTGVMVYLLCRWKLNRSTAVYSPLPPETLAAPAEVQMEK